MKIMFGKIAAHLLLILVPFFLFEIVFRLLPVSYPPYLLPVSSENPVIRYQPDKNYLYSKGWNFTIRARSHTNNFGYNNINNYDADEISPLLAVIGDSYVEAHQVDAGKSAAELLGSRVKNEGRVYSMGLSGAPLSQYLVFAEYARQTFQPNAAVFVIIGNDFDESLLKYKTDPGFHYFKEKGGKFSLEKVDYRISSAKKILRKSAFVRYVIFNLQGKALIERLRRKAPLESNEFVGNVPVVVAEERLRDSFRAIDEFLNQLPARSGLDSSMILFIIDGMRPALYDKVELEKLEDSYFAHMRSYFKKQARSRGYEVIDMQPIFIERYKVDNSRFEFKSDGHWNELGHRVVAQAIGGSSLFNNVFPR